MYLLYIFLFLITYKLIRNAINYFKCRYFRKLYKEWINKKSTRFAYYKVSTVKLLNNAGLSSPKVPYTQPTGFCQAVTVNADVFDNCTADLTFIRSEMMQSFAAAIGVYRSRMLDAVSPFYWIDLILFLPRHILEYLNVKTDTVATKALNAFLSLIWWLLSVVFVFFKEDIIRILSKCFQNILG